MTFESKYRKIKTMLSANEILQEKTPRNFIFVYYWY